MNKNLFGEHAARLSLIASMAVFGTIGIFRKYILLPSGFVAMARGLLGALFLLAVILLRRRKVGEKSKAVRAALPKLCLSGVLIGFNWILLFEAYRYTTVATATLCYYMAPILVILASPFLLRERITARKGIAVALSLVGIVLVSGVTEGGDVGDGRGILLGLGAALLYATIILLNKTLPDLSPFEKTFVQLAVAGVVLIPYTLLAEVVFGNADFFFDLASIVLLLFLGVVHTGIAYALYFGSMGKLPAHTISIFSYIDPVLAILLSAWLLHEPMSPAAAIGAVLILGAAFLCELPVRKK
ncbi:MAG: DMT family transporter [Clostridia bacterium]|nr:DMT family transporter [Clostridia bacterium]